MASSSGPESLATDAMCFNDSDGDDDKSSHDREDNGSGRGPLDVASSVMSSSPTG